MIGIGILTCTRWYRQEYKGLVPVGDNFELISGGIDVGWGEVLNDSSPDFNLLSLKAGNIGVIAGVVAKGNRDWNRLSVGGPSGVDLDAWTEVAHPVAVSHDYLVKRKSDFIEANVVDQSLENVATCGSTSDSQQAVILIDVFSFIDRPHGSTVQVGLESLTIVSGDEVIP